MKRLLAAAVVGLTFMGVGSTTLNAQEYYYCCHCGQPHVRYQQRSESFVRRNANRVYWSGREVTGSVAAVVTTLHPGIRIADWMGFIDRRQIVRNIRGY